MGWVSILEDNEKLRSHWEAIHSTLDTLRKWPETSRYSDPDHANFRAQDLSNRVNALMADFDKMLEELHQDALRRLGQPGVTIVKQIDKKAAQLNKKRDELAEAKMHLAKARSDNENLRAELRNSSETVQSLEKELALFKQKSADSRDWQVATGDIRPIRK